MQRRDQVSDSPMYVPSMRLCLCLCLMTDYDIIRVCMCVCVDQIVTHQSIIRVFAWNKCRPNRKTVRCIYFVGFHTRTLCPDDSFNQICSAHMIRFGETLR